MTSAAIAVFGDVAATCWPIVWRLFLTCGGLVALAGISWWASERAWQRWRRHRARLTALMDRSDGQGGIPPASWRARGDGVVPLDQLTVNAEFERLASQLHYDTVRDMLDSPED